MQLQTPPFDEAPRSAEPVLSIRCSFNGGIYLIALYGELDVATAPEVERELLRAEATDATQIVLDLSALHFMDSTAVQLLLDADARSRADGSRLAMLRAAPGVQQVLDMSGVSDRLPFLG